MCVIAYKDKKSRLPSEENIRAMWSKNPHGAGVMWRRDDGMIEFQKGFMTLDSFLEFFNSKKDDLKNKECSFHFRITTHGGTCAENCHPFVIGESPHIKHGVKRRVLMHNGILPIKPRANNISDTGELTIRLGRFDSPRLALQTFNECLEGNRIILMDEDGTHFFGDDFKRSSDKNNEGLLYSNLHFENSFQTKGFSPIGRYDDYDEYDYDDFDACCYFDKRHNCFKDQISKDEVPILFVNEDELTEEDYEEWRFLMEEDTVVKTICRHYRISFNEYLDIREGARYSGLSFDDYVEWCYEESMNEESMKEKEERNVAQTA